MRIFGRLLMVFGGLVGVAVGLGMFFHLGVAAPWLVNVALAKLGLVTSGALMAGGALTIRLASRIERARLRAPNDERFN